MAIQQIYEYSFEMNYVMNNKVTELPQELIKYVMIDYDYDTKIMPIIYVSLTTTQKIFDQLDDNVDKGYISLIIRNIKTVYTILLYKSADYKKSTANSNKSTALSY